MNKIIDDVIALNKHMETRKLALNTVYKRSNNSRVNESAAYSERNVKEPIKINNKLNKMPLDAYDEDWDGSPSPLKK